MIRDQEKDQIRQWADGREGGIMLRYATAGHSMDGLFRDFVDLFSELSACVRMKKDTDAVVSLPSLFIGSQVTYQALPLDRELEPFLAVIGDVHAFSDRIAEDVQQRLVQLKVPALVKVYITPHCPYCPTTVSLLLGLAACSAQIRITVVDGELFPDAAQKDQVSTAPTVILDDQFRWIGSVDAGELVSLMLDRDPAILGADALRGMIEDGNAEGVARMMVERGKLFDSFVQLLGHPRWSVRLGAMVVFETLVEQDPGLAAGVVEPLVAVFSAADELVRGDLLHVLGESGNRAALPFLADVAAGDHDEEVQSAAQEAIEKLK